MATHHRHRNQSSGSNFQPASVSDSSLNPSADLPSSFELVPFYYEQSDEIDWSRPRQSWNINQDYTYFNLFGRIAREDFTINQLLANPEEFANGDLFPHEWERFDYAKSGQGNKICVVCEKNEHKERIASLSCGHGYHVYCMENWLQNWNICPLCKFNELGFPEYS